MNDLNLNNESDIKTAFDLFKNKKSDNLDLSKLFEAKQVLNIRDNDALWLILIIMESYNQNFISSHEQIKKLLLSFPESLESTLDELLKITEVTLNQKLLLDIEDKSVDLQSKLVDEVVKLIKKQPVNKIDFKLIVVMIFLGSLLSILFLFVGLIIGTNL